jgi:prepilin peptidase CpaA
MSYQAYSNLMLAILASTAVVAAWNDYRRHRVPNLLTCGVLAAGLAAQGLLRGLPGLQEGLLGVLAGAGPLFLLWMMKGMGAGDVKLMGAFGAWLGPTLVIKSLVVGGLLGGVMALVVIAARRNWREASTNLGLLVVKASSARTAFGEFSSAASLSGPGGALPYAIPLSAGALVVVLSQTFGWWEAL